MRCGYFDCFSGAAGDMILAALVDAGVPVEVFQRAVADLKLPDVRLSAEKVKRHGLAATYVRVELGPAAQKKHRHLPEIAGILDAADLSQRVRERARAVFQRLGEAEAAVHNTTIEKVHFHEVGAADAIVDIVCACVGVEHLGLERIVCSPIPVGGGTVTCEHGVMPVPAPATARLLTGFPIAACEETGELCTPTGAALLTTLADEFGPPPAMTIRAVGVGAGTREGQTRPNILRLIVGEGEAASGYEQDTVVVLETHCDDVTGQTTAYAVERLLAAGALDAYIVPIIMKKGRPGQLLSVLARPADADALEAILFAETGTLGVRRREAARRKLARAHVTVATRFGPIRVKVGRRGDRTLRAWPEYEDCAAAAGAAGVALGEVQQEALRIWSQGGDDAGRDR